MRQGCRYDSDFLPYMTKSEVSRLPAGIQIPFLIFLAIFSSLVITHTNSRSLGGQRLNLICCSSLEILGHVWASKEQESEIKTVN